GLWCDGRRTTGLALQAHLLLVPEDVELVAGSGLPRQAQRDVGPGAVIHRALVQVGLVRPRVGIAVVLVVIHPRHVETRDLAFGREKEPETIAKNRAANGPVRLPRLDQFIRVSQAGIPQLLREVAPLHRAVGAAEEERTGKG